MASQDRFSGNSFTSQRLRNIKVTWPLLLGLGIVVFLLKYASVVVFGFGSSGKELFPADVQKIRLDAGPLTRIKLEGKKGEFLISVNADDLDDILGSPSAKEEFPRLPHILLHDPLRCQKTPHLDYIVYVHSSPSNREKRDLLRQTYANGRLYKNRRLTVIFLLGLPKQIGLQEEIKKEFEEYRDIVQGYFVDSYRNITLKAVMGLKWISIHCKEAAFAIKVDDDTFMNVFEILPFLEQNYNRSLVLICPVWKQGTMKVLRERKSCMKWCVTKREFRETFYPRYCAGISYTMSRDLIQRLTVTAEKTPFFWIDDVYITGLLTRPLAGQIHYVDIMKHFTLNERQALDQYSNESQPITTYLVHVKNKDNFLPLWKSLAKRLTREQKNTIDESVLKSLR